MDVKVKDVLICFTNVQLVPFKNVPKNQRTEVIKYIIRLRPWKRKRTVWCSVCETTLVTELTGSLNSFS